MMKIKLEIHMISIPVLNVVRNCNIKNKNGDKELLHCHPYKYIVEDTGTDEKGG